MATLQHKTACYEIPASAFPLSGQNRYEMTSEPTPYSIRAAAGRIAGCSFGRDTVERKRLSALAPVARQWQHGPCNSLLPLRAFIGLGTALSFLMAGPAMIAAFSFSRLEMPEELVDAICWSRRESEWTRGNEARIRSKSDSLLLGRGGLAAMHKQIRLQSAPQQELTRSKSSVSVQSGSMTTDNKLE